MRAWTVGGSLGQRPPIRERIDALKRNAVV